MRIINEQLIKGTQIVQIYTYTHIQQNTYCIYTSTYVHTYNKTHTVYIQVHMYSKFKGIGNNPIGITVYSKN